MGGSLKLINRRGHTQKLGETHQQKLIFRFTLPKLVEWTTTN